MNPINLKMKNFFSHRDTDVDFSLFDSVLLIGNVEGDYDISNGSGKSAVFEGILWCLFNKSRVAAIDDIIMWGENDCLVELVFTHEGVKYRITRTRTRTTSTSTVHFECENDDGVWVDLSGSTSRLTNQEILRKIKFDYKTFINSAYFRQNDISEFAVSDPSKKKDILKSIIDISKWDEYEKRAKGKLRQINGECKVLATLCEGYEELSEELKLYELKLKEVSASVSSKTARRKTVEESVDKLASEYNQLKKSLDTDQWDRVSEEIASLEKKRTTVVSSLGNTKVEIEKYKRKADNLKSQADECISKAEALDITDDEEEELSKLREELITHKSNASASDLALKKLSKRIIVEGECYACGQDVDDHLHEKLVEEYQKEIDEHKKKEIYSKNKANEIASKITKIESSMKNRRIRDGLLSKSRGFLTEMEIAESHRRKLVENYKQYEDSISKIENKISIGKKVIESLRNDDFREIRERLTKLRSEKAELIAEIEILNRDLGVYTEKVSNNRDKLKSMEDSRKLFLEKTEHSTKLSKLAKMFGKNGIQTILLNAVIEDLEKTSNKILNTICNEPFTVLLETQRIGSDGISVVDTLDLRVKKDGINQNFKSLSGGEQFRVSLALRIALSEISSRHGGSALEFLLLDEINSPLDRQGTETLFVNVIRSLEQKYKIMVITHDDSLKNRFNNVLDVSKVNGESSVTFVAR